MLDACPHHHEEPEAALAAAAETALDGIRLRAPGESKPGKKIWRSLDELARTKSFETMLHREFPHAASEWKDGPSRRNFLKLMSASLAFAGLSACTLKKTDEKIVPYVNAPEDVIPGRPLFFASTMPFAGYGKGVVVESHEGRPTKIEGNDKHPASSLGASDAWMQASILELYDPDRSQTIMHGKTPSTWGAFTTAMVNELADKVTTGGKGMYFLTATVTSPTMARQMKALAAKFPQAKWHQYETLGRRNTQAGAIEAFGTDVETIYKIDQADVILALDSNFLMDHAGCIPYSQQFTDGRKIRQGDGELKMNRLYVAESALSVTGAQADHRLAIKCGEIESLAADILAALTGRKPSGANAKWAGQVAADLLKNKGKALVMVGETQPASVHAMGHAINATLGAVGNTLSYIDPVEVAGDTLENLATDLNAGAVDMLFVIGTNPSFTAPRHLGFAEGLTDPTAADRDESFKKNPLSKVRLIVHHGLFNGDVEETAGLCHWHVPASHYLESWGDLRAFDGTASIIQPLIYPLYTTKTEIELFAFLLGDGGRAAYDIIQETWTREVAKLSDDDWQRSLESGVIAGTAFTPKAVTLVSASTTQPTTKPASDKMEIVFRTDPTIFDGRFANSGWLQELAKPITLLTWENVALMSVKTAHDLEISQADQGRGVDVNFVSLEVNGKKLAKIPALILPGHVDDSITVYVGYGRFRAGRVGLNLGWDTYKLRSATTEWFASDLNVTKLDETTSVATIQSHHLMDLPTDNSKLLDLNYLNGRDLIKKFKKAQVTEGTEKTHRKIKLDIVEKYEVPEREQRLLPEWKYENNKWGMVIDNQACIGCNACVIACQSENNIAIVGKDEVLKGREMHWIRIDTYFLGNEANENVEVFNQPIPCMQCENAPCELVCPVEATSTSSEGINEQTYNRCVGTRYCSNNCPYKVRRFNFLQYTDYETPQVQLQRNPNVTVRARGIMEKCNFCVQRVNNARIEAKKQDRPIVEGEVKMACQQSCPTQAITFGNLNVKEEQVTQLQNEPLRYTLLDELNALPRVSYLGRVKNPNPEMATV